MWRTGVILAAAVLLFPTRTMGQATSGGVRWERDLITAVEIEERAPDAKSAYDVVQRLRPQFLRVRASGSIQKKEPVPVQVYVDGTFRGTPYVLRDLNKDGVVEIRYLSGSDATTRFGTGHENGAIIVRTGNPRRT